MGVSKEELKKLDKNVETARTFEPDPDEAPDEDLREAIWELGRAG